LISLETSRGPAIGVHTADRPLLGTGLRFACNGVSE
jgi:hypothetical protein